MYKKFCFDGYQLYITEFAESCARNHHGRTSYISFIGDTKAIKALLNKAKITGINMNIGRTYREFTIKLGDDSCFVKTYYDKDIGHLVIFRKRCEKNSNLTPYFLYLNEDYSDIFLTDRDAVDYRTFIGDSISDLVNGMTKERSHLLYRKIFDIIKEKTTIPVLDDWADYIVKEFFSRKLISACTFVKYNVNNDQTEESIVVNHSDYKMILEILFNPSTFKDIVTRGLKDNHISIDGTSDNVRSKVEDINTIDEYIDNFGQILCDKVTNNFNPLFNPASEELSQEIKDRTSIAAAHSNIFSYTAQENAEEAITRSMEINKHTILSGACGSGKSGMAALAIDAHARKRKHKNYAALVMCPGTMPKEWYDTISNAIPFSECVMINDLSDIIKLKDKINDSRRKRPIFGIVTYSTAKNGYDVKPAVKYSPSKKRFVCPDCGEPIEIFKDILENIFSRKSETKKVDALDIDFFEQTDKNMFCSKCGAPLWTAATKTNIGNWIKITKVGWALKDRVNDIIKSLSDIDNDNFRYHGNLLRQCDKKKLKTKYNYLRLYESSDKKVIMRLANNFPIARFIRQHMRKNFDYVICDEAHTVEGNSLQHQAFSDVIQSCWRSLSLTGTLSNGYASGLFNILFKTQTAKMLKEGFGYNSCSNFVDKYGVTEISEESVIRPTTYKYNEEGERVPDKYRVMRQVSFKKKPVAGVSPMIFANYLMNNTVFLKQEDITKELVPYNEIPVGIDMDDELKNRYEEITNIIRTRAIEGTISTNNASRTAIKGMITYLDMMLEQPFGLDDIVNMDGHVVIESKELDSKKIRNKEQYLIDLCKRKKEAKEKILIYVHWTGKTCIQERLKKVLGDNEIKAEIMTDKIKMADRQEWVNNKSKDVDAIIVNPRLVDVGLNLLPYTTIVFYEIGNQLSVIRQSSKRSWRINQTHPVEVYFMYYKNTVQEQLLGAISQKLKAATAIEGNFSAEGLSSVSGDTDMMNMIASSIVNNESIEIENDGFESIGSVSAGEARKLRAESCIKLGLREGFEYGTVNMMYGSNNTKTKKRSAKQNKTTIDLYDTLSAVI